MAPQVDAEKSDDAPADRDYVLRVLYGCSSGLAVFQILWGIGRLPMELTLATKSRPLAEIEAKVGSTVLDRGLETKYYGEAFVFLTHTFPALIWSAIVPFQLHPASRSPSLKKVHRTLGSTFFFLSATMMAGLAAIVNRDLTLHPGAGYFKGVQGTTVREMPKLLAVTHHANKPFLVGSATWFTYTMYRALKAAWRKRFTEHEDWAMRHIASGQWVALMRIFFMPTLPLVFSRYGDTQEVLSSAFIGCAIGGWIACVSAAELAVHRVRANREKTKAARIAKRRKADQAGMATGQILGA